jgi:hypothetical protein
LLRAAGLAFSLLFIVAGLMTLYGAYRRWPMLIDPPEDLWFSYSQAGIKKLFGKRITLVFTYFLGAMFVSIGGLGLFRVLTSN